MNQARFDLKAAEWNLEGGFYNTVCFLSQQAAEKALKAAIYFSGISRRKLLTHSVFELSREAMKAIPNLKDNLENARELDLHYIPSRYPNGLVSGYPHEFYGESTAQKALNSARKFIDLVDRHFKAEGFDSTSEPYDNQG